MNLIFSNIEIPKQINVVLNFFFKDTKYTKLSLKSKRGGGKKFM